MVFPFVIGYRRKPFPADASGKHSLTATMASQKIGEAFFRGSRFFRLSRERDECRSAFEAGNNWRSANQRKRGFEPNLTNSKQRNRMINESRQGETKISAKQRIFIEDEKYRLTFCVFYISEK